jgi:SAM-dependent methyltransferase
MKSNEIPIVSISFNTPKLLADMLISLRKFYKNPIHIVDGSDASFAPMIADICAALPNVTLHALGYNIHHGPGMAWAIKNLNLNEQVLFLDSDIVVLRHGFIEELQTELLPSDYGVGGVGYVNQDGFDIPYSYGAVPYLHPACMLCNVTVMRKWPLPIKHGAPMIEAMKSLHRTGQSQLLRHLDWTMNDITMGTSKKFYIDHIGKGTSNATGGYHLEEWFAELQSKKDNKELSLPTTGINPDLLALIPNSAQRLLEVGCSSGALAHAFKLKHPNCHYLGFEIDKIAAEQARNWCNDVVTGDIDSMTDIDFAKYCDRDCWIFGDVLEHLRDPWLVLERIRRVIPISGSLVISVPNAQHWSLQARLSVGDFRYVDGGLMDRTHIRWFTRTTLLEMLSNTGWKLEAGVPRIFNEPLRDKFLPVLRDMAFAMGGDPELAVNDALPLQYVVRAVPA